MGERIIDLETAYNSIKDRIPFTPDMGIVLGSGLGGFADVLDVTEKIPYSSIEGFPVSTVEGHAGNFLFAEYAGVKLMLMQGRVHFYEGYEMRHVVIPVRLMARLGIKTLLLSNAAGGIRDDLDPGAIMMITDHIKSFVPSPFIHTSPEDFNGVRFYDMSEVYNNELSEKMRQAAKEEGIDLKEGVYLQTTGPEYETPAEIRAYKTLGADAVGMSTTVEAAAANALGVKVAGISCITNKAAGLGGKLSHEEVTETANKVKDSINRLVLNFIGKM